MKGELTQVLTGTGRPRKPVTARHRAWELVRPVEDSKGGVQLSSRWLLSDAMQIFAWSRHCAASGCFIRAENKAATLPRPAETAWAGLSSTPRAQDCSTARADDRFGSSACGKCPCSPAPAPPRTGPRPQNPAAQRGAGSHRRAAVRSADREKPTRPQ